MRYLPVRVASVLLPMNASSFFLLVLTVIVSVSIIAQSEAQNAAPAPAAVSVSVPVQPAPTQVTTPVPNSPNSNMNQNQSTPVSQSTQTSSQPTAEASSQSAAPVKFPVTIASRRLLREGLTLATLSNGLTIIIQENHTAPVATVRCFVKNTGSAYETGHLGAGLSHVLEHVVAGGTTTKRTEDEVRRLVDLMGGVTNAFTSINMTAYFIDCPVKDTPVAIELIADSVTRCAFNPAEFTRELRVVQQELADGEVSRSRVMWKLSAELCYKKSPARLPVIGYLDVLKQTSNEDIIGFYKARYVPNNQVFVVVGDIQTEPTLELIRQQYDGVPRGITAEVVMPEEPQQLSPREIVKEMDGPTFDVTVFWPTIDLYDEDLYALDMLSFILGSGESSRLVKKYCLENPKTLGIDASSYTPEYAKGYFGVQMSLTEENYPNVVDEVVADLYKMRDTLVSETELEKAKKQKAAELVFDQQTIQNQANSLGRSFISSADPLFDYTYVQQLSKVTAEDIQRVARKYLVPERFNKVVIAPIGKAESVQTTASTFDSSDVVETKLENGVTVLVKRIPNLPLVNMQAYVLGATLTETSENAGICAMTTSLLDRGTATRSAAEIAEYFDSIGGAFGFSFGRNSFFGNMLVLKEDFSTSADIFADCLLNPSFPEEEFDKQKVLMLGAIQKRKANPRAEASELLFGAMPESTPYHIILGGTEESVQPMTLDQVKEYYATFVQPSNMVVAIYGDIDVKSATDIAKKHFGSLVGKPVPQILFDRNNAIKENIVKHKTIDKATGIVMIAYEAPSRFNPQDYAAMSVLNAIMTGYGYPGGWLFPELRGEGLVYAVSGQVLSGPCPGYFLLVAQTRPDAVNEVVTRIRRNVQKAIDGNITVEEFEKAKQLICAVNAQDNVTASSQAQQAAVDEILGFGYNYHNGFDERIQAVTFEQVKAVAKKYFRNSIQVTTAQEVQPAGTGNSAGESSNE